MEDNAVPLPSTNHIYIPQRTYVTFSYQKDDDIPDIIMAPLCPCIGMIVKSEDTLLATHIDLATKLELVLSVLNEKFKKNCYISLFTTDLLTIPDIENYPPSTFNDAQGRLDNLQGKLFENEYCNVEITKFNFEKENSLHYSKFTPRGFLDSDEIDKASFKVENIFYHTPNLRLDCNDFYNTEGGFLTLKNDVTPLTEFTIQQWNAIIANSFLDTI